MKKAHKTYTLKINAIRRINRVIRGALARAQMRRLRAAIRVQATWRMLGARRSYRKVLSAKRKREAQQRLIQDQKDKAMVLKRRKEAVKTIEKYWAFILLRRELRDKQTQWSKLPPDCRKLWMRFSALKEQAFDLKEEIRYMNFNKSE